MRGRRLKWLLIVVGGILLVAAAGIFWLRKQNLADIAGGPVKASLVVSSSDFSDNAMIPVRFTCNGTGVSPALEWSPPPAGTQSIAIVATDFSAPLGFTHWIVYDLPPNTRAIPEAASSQHSLPSPAREGSNDYGNPGYVGPCPPAGTHRYVFRVYALDTRVNLPPGATRDQLAASVGGHVLGRAKFQVFTVDPTTNNVRQPIHFFYRPAAYCAIISDQFSTDSIEDHGLFLVSCGTDMHADFISPGLRALIIEDEALIVEELKERLSGMGFSIVGAVDSADEGVAIAASERPDLVLMDIRLRGEKDGTQACREIREQVDPAIVYLTAYSDHRTVERVQASDHDGFILKPFRHHELHSTISVALQRRALRKKKPQ